MTNVLEIQAQNFQHKLGTIGEVVENYEDIEQCYETILTTLKGTIPFDPTFGYDLIDLIDKPVDKVISFHKTNIQTELNRQEPRATVVLVDITPVEVGSLEISIQYLPIGETQTQTATINIGN
jgi:phage baseplate assembly protein W